VSSGALVNGHQEIDVAGHSDGRVAIQPIGERQSLQDQGPLTRAGGGISDSEKRLSLPIGQLRRGNGLSAPPSYDLGRGEASDLLSSSAPRERRQSLGSRHRVNSPPIGSRRRFDLAAKRE
jgi:hypothetical protein